MEDSSRGILNFESCHWTVSSVDLSLDTWNQSDGIIEVSIVKVSIVKGEPQRDQIVDQFAPFELTVLWFSSVNGSVPLC